MCNFITKRGQCKLSKKRDLCHIHIKAKKLRQVVYKDSEIKNLNRSIDKKNLKCKEIQDQLENCILNNLTQRLEIKRLKEQIYELEIRDAERLEEISTLNEEKNVLQSDFDDYQRIKDFERIKKLIKKYVDTTDFNQIEFFMMQSKNKGILKEIMNIDEDFYAVYTKMRLRRNRLSHWWY